MTFPKPLMSFTELEQLGFSREMLKEWSREEEFPGFKTPGGGKWYVYTDQLEDFIADLNAARRNQSTAVIRRRRRRGRRPVYA